MANTLALLKATPHSVSYTVTEAATAAGAAVLTNPSADMVTGPLKTLLDSSCANQAAARTRVADFCDVMVYCRACGAAEPAVLVLDFDVSTTSFRISTLGVKVNDNDTATWIIELKYRHSLVK